MDRGNRRNRSEAPLNLSCGNNNRYHRGCLRGFFDVKTLFRKKLNAKAFSQTCSDRTFELSVSKKNIGELP